MNLKEHILNRKTVYHGGIINVEKQIVKIPTGERAERDVVHNHHGVNALVIDKNDNIILERQWREAVRQVMWEIPAGKVDSRDNGSSLHAIKRELNEELRITLDNNNSIRKITSEYTSPGFTDEFSTYYLVKNFHKATKGLPRDKDEYLKLYHISSNKAVDMVRNGKIKDIKTIMAITYWQLLKKENK